MEKMIPCFARLNYGASPKTLPEIPVNDVEERRQIPF